MARSARMRTLSSKLSWASSRVRNLQGSSPPLLTPPEAAALLVANYEPDVGFAWWLMENFWIQFAQVARKQGFEPIIAYPVGGAVPQAIRDAGIETMIHPFPGRGVDGFRRSLKLLRARRVRCVYFTDRAFTSPWYVLFRFAGVRRLINHDHTPGDRAPVRGLKGLLKAAWRRLPLMSCDLQICVSPLIRKRAIENAHIPAGRTMVIQNGIEPIQCEGVHNYVHDVLNLSPEARVCITVGRAQRYKRIDFVIEVARRCIFELGLDDLVFVHCGDGPDIERLEALAIEAGLGRRFVFAGRRSDVRKMLCSADCAIHAAKGEAFSLAVLEYMSAGLPVMVPDIPSVSQAIRHRETGLIYSDADSAQAADQLAELIENPALRNRLGKAAAGEVEENYSLTAMNDDFRRLVARMLSAA